MQTKEVLSHKYVKRLFIARFISNFGNGMGPIALAFGILALPNGSANMLGLVLGATTVVFLLMAPFGGVIADKYGRARMVGVTDMAAGLVLFIQVAYFATGDVPLAASDTQASAQNKTAIDMPVFRFIKINFLFTQS